MVKHTLWVEDEAQIKVVATPIRADIIDRLVALGPMSVRQLAGALGRRPTAIYHHLRQMEEQGLIRPKSIVKYGDGGGRPAIIYEAIAKRIRLARASKKVANHKAMAQAAQAVANQAAKDYAKAFDAGGWNIEGAGRNHWFFRVIATPSPERLARINEVFDQLADLVWTPDPNPGDPVSFAWFMAPVSSGERKARTGKRNGPKDPDR